MMHIIDLKQFILIEKTFFVAEGIIIAATVKLITNNSSIEYLLAFFIAVAGIRISKIWYKMHEKSSALAFERMKFLKKIEKENDLPVKFFGTSFYYGTVFIPRRFITSLNKNAASSIVHVQTKTDPRN